LRLFLHGGRKALVKELLYATAIFHFRRVEISVVVRGHVVQAIEFAPIDPQAAKLSQARQRLAVKDHDARRTAADFDTTQSYISVADNVARAAAERVSERPALGMTKGWKP
jgi:hypothetical protein